MNVKKRDGRTEKLQQHKIDDMINYIIGDSANINIPEVKRKMDLHLFDGIETSEIHETFTLTLESMITKDSPQYEYAAGRSIMIELYKEAYGSHIPMDFKKLIDRNIANGYYENIYDLYSIAEVIEYGKLIDHKFDVKYKYLGVRVFQDKYIISNKSSNRFIEGPQELYMLVSMLMFAHTKNKTDIINFYTDLNNFKVSLPSPIMSGLRTTKHGYASCCVIETADKGKGITACVTLLAEMGSLRAGIGISTVNIRGIGAEVNNGTVIHTGKIPILKWFEKSVSPFSQGSRNNSANNINAIWDWEVLKLLTIKSNKSTEENSVNGLSFSLLLPDLLFRRANDNEMFTLFSAEDVRELVNNLHDQQLWEASYLKYEADDNIRKKRISARQLIEKYATEYFENGRMHPIFITNANKGPFKVPIRTTNLCVEIYLPTTPIRSIADPDAELPLCMLANINAGQTSIGDLPQITKRLVIALNRIIDIQEYPNEIIRRTMMNGRYLAIGISDWAHYLAKKEIRYDTDAGLDATREFSEHMQYNLLKASNELAMEYGEAKWFRTKSKYADGWLPNDGKWEFISAELLEDLRQNIMKYGLYNLTLSGVPPAGTSADISGSTSGVKMPINAKFSKVTNYGPIPAIVPDYDKYGEYYTFGKDVDNKKYLKMISVMQNYIDQGISVDLDWFESDLIQEGDDKGKFPIMKMIECLFTANRLGMKSIYYSTFNDELNDTSTVETGCAGGACEI